MPRKSRAFELFVVRFAVALLVCAFAAMRAHAQRRSFEYTHPAMGTEFRIVLFASAEQQAADAANAAFDEADRIEALLSNYRDSSELSRINHDAAKQTLTTDPETFSFLTQAQHWSEASGGAFDMTVGPLMRLWGFYQHSGRVPDDRQIARTLNSVGYRDVLLDPLNRTVQFTHQGVELDPGGIGKGFAVDAMVRVLHEQNVSAALISAGSSTLFALGHPPAKSGWLVIVRMPDGDKQRIASISLRDESLSSANCSEKHFQASGTLYCHIMDPRTGRPVRGRVHVSVTHPSATASDALSNVLFVDTPEESVKTLRRFAPQSRALIVYEEDGKRRCLTEKWPGRCALP